MMLRQQGFVVINLGVRTPLEEFADAYCADGVEVSRAGLPERRIRARILCSAAAHFSIARAAGFLGLRRIAATDTLALVAEPSSAL